MNRLYELFFIIDYLYRIMLFHIIFSIKMYDMIWAVKVLTNSMS